MITKIREGNYILIETVNQTKILTLDTYFSFAWIMADNIGEILVTTHKKYAADHILSIGRYRLYRVENEKELTDQIHLELHVGMGIWQGYLLPHGLPTDKKIRNRIIPTKEIITKLLEVKPLSIP